MMTALAKPSAFVAEPATDVPWLIKLVTNPYRAH